MIKLGALLRRADTLRQAAEALGVFGLFSFGVAALVPRYEIGGWIWKVSVLLGVALLVAAFVLYLVGSSKIEKLSPQVEAAIAALAKRLALHPATEEDAPPTLWTPPT